MSYNDDGGGCADHNDEGVEMLNIVVMMMSAIMMRATAMVMSPVMVSCSGNADHDIR